jgi:hypothetical protein
MLVVLAGCGGSGPSTGFNPAATTSPSHTYFLSSPLLGGFSITLVSSAAIPTRLFTGLKIVRRAAGPPKCWIRRAVHGLQGQWAFLNGNLLTLKINGSGLPMTALCSRLRNSPFNPSDLTRG